MAYEGETSAGPRIEFGPSPAGMPLTPYPLGARDPFALSDRGLCFILSDTLIDLTGAERVISSRLVQQVTGGDGLQPAASFETAFNPHHERLVIHTVRVIRDGVPREVASPAAFELLRRELNLERAIYDGRVTAHMIVPDVRIGDVVETAFSIIGSNPVLGGRFSHHLRLQWASPTIETWCRIRTPEDRKLTIRTFGSAPTVVETAQDGVRELNWTVLDAEPYRHEPDAPSWWIGYAAVHVADPMSWTQVADLFRTAYEPPLELPEEMQAGVAAIAAAHADPAERAAEALRFVQKLLRYHSIGVGEGGYRPRSISDIWTTRYGDCKDASRLLTTVLRRLNIQAWPALVNTWAGAGLGDALPSATAFDHCIVKVVIAGRTWWLDPTHSPQAGRLDHLTPSAHHWALPLAPEATLEPMAEREQVFATDTTEIWTFARRADAAATLEITTVYRGWRADEMRRWRENDGPATVARRMREGLESAYGELTDTAAVVWTDRPEMNALQVQEAYSVDRPYTPTHDRAAFVRFESRDDLVGPNLRTLETPRRTEPIAVGAPRRLRTRRVFNFPVDVAVTPWNVSVDGPKMRGSSRFVWLSDLQAEQVVELAIDDPIVPASAAPLYFAFVRRMWSLNGVSLSLPVSKGRLVRADTGRPGWITWSIIIGIIAAFAIFREIAA